MPYDISQGKLLSYHGLFHIVTAVSLYSHGAVVLGQGQLRSPGDTWQRLEAPLLLTTRAKWGGATGL